VFNSDNKAIPVAWIITPRFASADAHRWMRALYNRVCMKDPSWKLAGFIVDDPLTDILTIRLAVPLSLCEFDDFFFVVIFSCFTECSKGHMAHIHGFCRDLVFF